MKAFTIQLKDIKKRHRFAPPTKKINSKKIYKRKKGIDSND